MTLNRHGQEKTFWVFTCVVRIKKYGKVRLAVIYDQPDRQGKTDLLFYPDVNLECPEDRPGALSSLGH